MRTVPFTLPRASALDGVQPSWEAGGCTRCELSRGCASPRTTPSRRVADDANTDGPVLYVMADSPTLIEVGQRALTGQRAAWLVRLLDTVWPGPVILDYALRCPTGNLKAKDLAPAHAACAPQTVAVLDRAPPAAVLVLGSVAHTALLGRYVDPDTLHDAACWLDEWECPVLPLPSVTDLAQNRLRRQAAESAIRQFVSELPARKTLRKRVVDVHWNEQVEVAESVTDALDLLARLTAPDLWAYDTETFGRQHTHAHHIALLGLASAAGQGVIPAPLLYEDAVRAAVQRAFRGPGRKAAANGKFDHIALRTLGCDVATPLWDTQLAAKLLNAAGLGRLELQAERVGMGGHKREMQDALKDATKRVRAAQRTASPLDELQRWYAKNVSVKLVTPSPHDDPEAWAYGLVQPDLLARYCASDCVATLWLAERQQAELAQTPMQRVWEGVTEPSIGAFARIEARGMPIDRASLDLFRTTCTAQRESALRGLQARGLDNPGSPKQVGAWLVAQGVTTGRTTDTGAMSTDEAALLAVADRAPAVRELLAFRGVDKLLSTYGDGIAQRLGSDGRIHTSYMLDGTETGRLSSRDPNLQNIPRPESDLDKLLRSAFAAPAGRVLLQADYSQLEVKIAALLSGDPAMIAAVNNTEVDVHLATARNIAKLAWGEDWATWTPEHQKKRRTAAKAVVFGILYGKTPASLATDLGMTVRQAEAVFAGVFGAYPGLQAAVRAALAEAERSGYVWTEWDGAPARRRPMHGVTSPLGGVASNAKNGCWNTRVQGTGADYCTRSVARLETLLPEMGFDSAVIGTVHDSILFEAVPDELTELVPLVDSVMTGWPSGAVRLAVDFETGPHWGALKKYELPTAR